MIARQTITRLREAADMPKLVREYIPLRRSGKDWSGLCPFHKEHTPSFIVHHSYAKCFGCGVSCDAISFLQRIGGHSFQSALEDLSSRYGIPLDDAPAPTKRDENLADKIAYWWRRKQCALWSTYEVAGRVERSVSPDDDWGPMLSAHRTREAVWSLIHAEPEPKVLVMMYRRMVTEADTEEYYQHRKQMAKITDMFRLESRRAA